VRRNRSIYICMLVIVLISLFPSTCSANETGKVIIVFMDRVSLAEIQEADTPNLNKMTAVGAVGLMTTNTAGSRSQRDAYVTLGAGARATGSDKSRLGFGVEEIYGGKPIQGLYQQITGMVVEAPGIVNLGIAQTIRNNENRPYGATVGALGEALKKSGLKAAILGNCDTDGEYNRYLTSFLMDGSGLIPMGIVDRTLLRKDSSRPFGIVTDYEILFDKTIELLEQSDVIAIQLGDTSRAEDFRYDAKDEKNIMYKRQAIEEGDAFIGRLLDNIDLSEDLLMVITPLSPARELAVNNRLTPFFTVGPGIERGWAYSPSTRRPGVITNLDICATVLDYLGLSGMPGQQGTVVGSYPSDKGAEGLLAFNERLVEIFNQRSFLLKSYVIVQIVSIILSLSSIIIFKKLLWVAKALLVFVMTIPLSYLFLTLYHQPTLAYSFFLSWLFAALLTGILLSIKISYIDRIFIICLFTSISLIIDQITGGQLIQGSPLGYDVISASRFYGIGNEYMGILIGAACAGCGAMMDISTKHKWLAWVLISLLCIAVLLAIGHPGFGANVGGTVSAAAAFALLLLLLRGKRIKMLHLLPAGIAVIAVLVGIFIVDSLKVVGSQSHIGRTVTLIKQGGIGGLVDIIYRKYSMNLKLIRYTIWTRVFLASLIAVVTLLYRPMGILKSIIGRYQGIAAGTGAAVAGSIVALLTNDSGIVAAATAMVYVASPIILLVIGKLEAETGKSEIINVVS
jgi:hypothetical protein